MSKAPPQPPATPPSARPPARRVGGVRTLADLVPAIGDTAFRKFGFVQSALLTRWPEIVGNRFARVTHPESLRFARGTKAEGTLRLTVSSAAAPMVQHMVPDLMASVNRFFGYRAVGKITLLQGVVRRSEPATVQPAATAPAAPAPVAPPAPAPASLRAVADPELRAVLEGLAATLGRVEGPPKIS